MDTEITSSTATSHPSDFKNHEVDVQVHDVVIGLDQTPLNGTEATVGTTTLPSTSPAEITIPSDFQIN